MNLGTIEEWNNTFGPILFTIYINDLLNLIKLIADNTKLYNIKNHRDIDLLKEDLQPIKLWSEELKTNRRRFCRRLYNA